MKTDILEGLKEELRLRQEAGEPIARIPEIIAYIEELKVKAHKWEAFMSSHQFKVYGSGGLGNIDGCQHMGIEIWDRQPAGYQSHSSLEHHERSKGYIETYVATIIARELK